MESEFKMNAGGSLRRSRIVLTRGEEQSASTSGLLEAAGAAVSVVPTIRIECAELSAEDGRRISAFREYDAIIFSSLNGVRNFFRLLEHGNAGRAGDGKKPLVVAIGSKTAEALDRNGMPPDLVPEKFNSKELIDALAKMDWKDKKVLIPAGSLSGNDVAEFIRSHGGFPDKVVVYRTLPNDNLDENVRSEVAEGRFDTVAFFSPSQVENFLAIFGKGILSGKRIAVIGPATRKAAEKAGLHVDVQPEVSTAEELVLSLVKNEEA